MFDVMNEVLAAASRIHHYIRKTPLDYSIRLSKLTGVEVYLKCENLQFTSAFKARGAFNKLLTLSLAERTQGVVTASSGNHGTAVAFGLHQLKMKGMVFVPENASPAKVEAIQSYGVPIEFHGNDTMVTERFAKAYAKQHDRIYISPYNDQQVISGQGTIGYELINQLKSIDAVIVPIGGGGLIAGIAGFLKQVAPHIQIIGAQPINSPVMTESIKAGKIIEMHTLPTISDATAGGIVADAITFPLCQRYVDQYILVSEEEIKQAIVTLIKTHYMLVEGAAGVALAALIKCSETLQGKNVVIILSGAKISVENLKSVLAVTA
ncbi:MAG: threonine/serine dehydratase [Gammaproteobacteria bacterium]|nr:threonine/serine dehydratase [Gammaproteobacteria bacterium]